MASRKTLIQTVVLGTELTTLYGQSTTTCVKNSDCQQSEYYCDTAIKNCRKCITFPCHENVIADQGYDMCKLQCPGYWKDLVTSKNASTSGTIDGTNELVTQATDIRILSEYKDLKSDYIIIIALCALGVVVVLVVLMAVARVVSRKYGKRLCRDVEVCGLGTKKAIEEENFFAPQPVDNDENKPNTELQRPILVRDAHLTNEGDLEFGCLEPRY